MSLAVSMKRYERGVSQPEWSEEKEVERTRIVLVSLKTSSRLTVVMTASLSNRTRDMVSCFISDDNRDGGKDNVHLSHRSGSRLSRW